MVTFQSVIIWLFISVFIGVVAYFFRRKGKINFITSITIPLLALYLSFVTTITIVSRQPTLFAQYNLLPFWSYKAIFNGIDILLAQVLWNVVLFIPIGILLMLILSCKHKCIISVAIGFLLSSLIEVLQLISHRGLFEFDDIVHNTLGTILGVSLYLLFCKIYKHLES